MDAVSLDGLVTTLDVSESLYARGPMAGFIDDTWNMQPAGNVTVGVLNQIEVSLGEVDMGVDWRYYGIGNPANGQEKLKAIDTFRYFMDPLQMVLPVFYYRTNDLLPMSFAMQAPFTVTRKIVQTTSWQANDPLVHYRVSDLRDRMNLVQIVTTGPNITLSLMRDFNLGKINDRYHPWGGRFGYPTSIDEMNPALVDPLLWNPDYWDFPVGRPLLGTAVLGRVHRGTPWQTLYLKSAALSATDWTNQGQAMASHPTNDWAVAEELVAMLNTQSPLQLLSINDTNQASWLAILDGMEVVTNTLDGCVVEVVSSNSPGAIAVYEGLQRERNGRPGRFFRAVRELLSVPELSLASPWIGPEQWRLCPNDAAYEALPAQILPQLRADPVGSIVPLGQNWRITFTGWDGFSYRVEQSTDLQHWEFYGTFVAEERGISFTIPTPEPGTSQFFRAILIPWTGLEAPEHGEVVGDFLGRTRWKPVGHWITLDQESLGWRGCLNGFLPAAFRPLPLALERFPPFGDIPFSHWAARSWYLALLGPCTASMCNCMPKGTFCLQMGHITTIALAGLRVRSRTLRGQRDGYLPLQQAHNWFQKTSMPFKGNRTRVVSIGTVLLTQLDDTAAAVEPALSCRPVLHALRASISWTVSVPPVEVSWGRRMRGAGRACSRF